MEMLGEDEREAFLDMIQEMLDFRPEERLTIKGFMGTVRCESGGFRCWRGWEFD
jgi:hypothetical protein